MGLLKIFFLPGDESLGYSHVCPSRASGLIKLGPTGKKGDGYHSRNMMPMEFQQHPAILRID